MSQQIHEDLHSYLQQIFTTLETLFKRKQSVPDRLEVGEKEDERERGRVWERERAACQSYYKICLCFIKNLRLASTAGNEH